jgi:hypothetical protein
VEKQQAFVAELRFGQVQVRVFELPGAVHQLEFWKQRLRSELESAQRPSELAQALERSL